jgi:hypothetical protein
VVNFGTYLPHKTGGREARQEQAGSENGTDDGFPSNVRSPVIPTKGSSINRLEGDRSAR